MATLNLSKALSSGGLKVNSTPTKTISASNIKTTTATPVNISKAISSGGLTVNSAPKTTTKTGGSAGVSKTSSSGTSTSKVANQTTPGAINDQIGSMDAANINTTGTNGLTFGNKPPVAPATPAPTTPVAPAPTSTTPATTPTPPVSPAKQGYDTLKANNVPASTTMGDAMGIVNDVINQANPEDQSKKAQNLMEQSPEWQQWQKDIQESKKVQNETSVDFIRQAMKEFNIQGINHELLDINKIINGTEDQIRQEVQAVGGFATDSQVLALAMGRNKALIAKSKDLEQEKADAMQMVSMMSNAYVSDRNFAQQAMMNKLQIDQKQLELKQQQINASKEGYNNVIKSMGYDGLYKSLVNSGDPTALATVEKTLGLAPGQLRTLASQPNLDTQIKQAQLDKLRNENTSTLGGVDEKTMTKIQSSPEYKTINGVLPALQAMRAYKDAVDKYGTTEMLSGSGKGELAGTYGNAIAAWKTLAGLGALSGADFALAENAVPSTGFFQRSSTMKGKLDASINNAISQAENLTQRLIQNYPNASEVLGQQLDQMKVISNPDKYQVAPDGQVIEFTN
jgi:DNA-binding phage protein